MKISKKEIDRIVKFFLSGSLYCPHDSYRDCNRCTARLIRESIKKVINDPT